MLLAIEWQQANSGLHRFVARGEAKGSMRRWPADAHVTGHCWSKKRACKSFGKSYLHKPECGAPCWERRGGTDTRTRAQEVWMRLLCRDSRSQAVYFYVE